MMHKVIMPAKASYFPCVLNEGHSTLMDRREPNSSHLNPFIRSWPKGRQQHSLESSRLILGQGLGREQEEGGGHGGGFEGRENGHLEAETPA